MIKQYTIHHIDSYSLLKIGGILGFIVSFVPITATIFGVLRLVNIVIGWMEGMVYQLRLPLIGGLDINVVELLHLTGMLEALQNISVIGGLGAIFLAILLSLLAAIFWGFIAVIAGAIFNLLSKATGGIQVSMSEDYLPVENETQDVKTG
jgi:hypothetical protein